MSDGGGGKKPYRLEEDRDGVREDWSKKITEVFKASWDNGGKRDVMK